MDNKWVIKCPNCGREYVPCEVLYPRYVLGHTTEVERDIYGKILYADGLLPSNTESYVCDHCNKRFNINIDMHFTTTVDNKFDFDNDYTSSLYDTDRLTLKED